jgi:beta-glucanase (GH16 family)
MNELDTGRASGSMRLVVPLNSLIELLSDPTYLFTGTGAGSTFDLGSAWPVLKLTNEYGVITMLAFVFLYASAFFGSYNIPVKIATTVIFHFTGGYLHDSSIVQFFALIFCMTEPVRNPVKAYYTQGGPMSSRAALAVAGCLVCASMPLAAEVQTPAGVSAIGLTFDDEFDNFVSSPKGNSGWMTTYPYEGEAARALPAPLSANKEAQFYSDSSVGINPFSVHDGVLQISAAPSTGYVPYGLHYTSGIITTLLSFSQTYGYFEIRVKLPAGKGLWSGFWLLPSNYRHDYYSELDIFEILGDAPGTLYATTHHAGSGNKWTGNLQSLSIADSSADFHTYGADWEPDKIIFYMDGKVIATATTPPPMNKPMYILANLAVGDVGSWPGAPDKTTKWPAVMQIDYVRAFATASTKDVQGRLAVRSGNITGHFRRSDGRPWAWSEVSLRDANNHEIATTTTDADGLFAFHKLPAGSYQIHTLSTQNSGRISLATGQSEDVTIK